jgi:hypothetical protein
MPNDGGVSAKVAGAKKALEDAKNSNVSTRSGKPFAGAPSGKAAEPAKKPGILEGLKKFADDRSAEADNLSAGLKYKRENVEQYAKASGESAMPKMHKGGKVKKDGPHDLKKDEVVLTKEQAKKKGVTDGMKESEEKSEKKDNAKEEKAEKKTEKKDGKKHKFSRTEIEHHKNGSHTVRHHLQPSDAKEDTGKVQEPVSYSAADDADLQAKLSQSLGGQEAPPSGQEAPPAGAVQQ